MIENKFIDLFTEDIISKLAQDEVGKRQYYRPVYSIHKWWARRPGALFRSIILRSIENDKPLFNNLNSHLFQQSNYFKDHNFENITILDPFMGGGTTLVESNRLGAKVIGSDINPVSYWIVRETLKNIDSLKLKEYYLQLEKSAGINIKKLYATNCGVCENVADGMYYFWLRYLPCPHCNEPIYLFKHTFLNRGLSRTKSISKQNPATLFCPKCFALNDWTGSGKCLCVNCKTNYDPYHVTYDKGSFNCYACGTTGFSLVKTLRNKQMLNERLLAIEYNCNSCKKRMYKIPSAKDLANLIDVSRLYRKSFNFLKIPKQKIIEGDSSRRWINHNYIHYADVFSKRQILSYNILFEEINKIPEEEYRHSFFTILSNSLEYNNMMTPYNYPHRKLHHLFTHHALPLTTTPVENVVWGAGKDGAGTFTNCYLRYLKAKEYNRKPFDKYVSTNKLVHTISPKNENICAQFVTDFESLKKTPKGALVLCGDSSKLSGIPASSVDFVITDPPYFDSIHYSELSNFFYVWLKEIIDHPYFESENVPTDNEAIVNKRMKKGTDRYTYLLFAVFKECERVLVKGGKLIFTYHTTKAEAWWSVLMAINESGFILESYFPVMSEYKVNPHIREKQSLDMDLVLICSKKNNGIIKSHKQHDNTIDEIIKSLPINCNYNKLFLHFIGKLLQIISIAPPTQNLDYIWFNEAIKHFDVLIKRSDYKKTISLKSLTSDKQASLFD